MYEDAAMFNVELSQSQYDFFQKHAAAFRRMCEEQVKWTSIMDGTVTVLGLESGTAGPNSYYGSQ